MPLIWHNGNLFSPQDIKFNLYDHGLLYGDGVFEGIRQYHGRVFRKQAHLERLFDSARAIRLAIPYTHEQVDAAIEATLAANKFTDCYIRLVATRGINDLGISPADATSASVFIIADKIQMYPAVVYASGMPIITASTIRSHPNMLSPRIKSLNYLNNINAKWEAIDAGVREAVMLNHLGFVCECTADNIFIVRQGRLLTPGEDAGILAGITRGAVLELARAAGIPVAEINLTRFDLYAAEECFITGTGAEIVPVTKIDNRPIGKGTPGPMTAQLTAAFHQLTREG